MRKVLTSMAKSAGGKAPLALLGVLVTLIGGAAVYAATAKKTDFSLAAAPASQTVSQGGTASYTITVTRLNGFTGSVALAASNLPSGATAQFSPSSTIDSTATTGTLKLKAGSATPAGTYTVTVTGTSGSLVHSTTVQLVVQSAAQPAFTVAASPASQTVAQGGATSFSVTVARTGGFTGSVGLAVSGLPSGATATWSPSSTVASTAAGATLNVQTATSTPTGTFNLSISGTGTINGQPSVQSATVALVVSQSQSLQISGDATGLLTPGTTVPLNLTLTNPYNFTLQVSGISIAMQEGTSNAGCSASQNFTLKQLGATVYPLALPAGASRTLSQLGVLDRDMPKLNMINQPWNQDACKNATVRLTYSGSATK
jgi:hypothetical protein